MGGVAGYEHRWGETTSYGGVYKGTFLECVYDLVFSLFCAARCLSDSVSFVLVALSYRQRRVNAAGHHEVSDFVSHAGMLHV